MKPLLLLVDMQRDYLGSPGLHPHQGCVVAAASLLLQAFREAERPVIHAWTTVDRRRNKRMEHWQRAGRWRCVRGTRGHETPAELTPRRGERVIHKTVFSPFVENDLTRLIRRSGADTVVIAGVHLHACVRATTLDAYQRGLRVIVADNAVASDDPLHGQIARRYLGDRAILFAPVSDLATAVSRGGTLTVRKAAIHHVSPHRPGVVRVHEKAASQAQLDAAVAHARSAWASWQDTPPARRAAILDGWAKEITGRGERLAGLLVDHIGKPITMAREEVAGAAQTLGLAARFAGAALKGVPRRVRYAPLGVVAVVTPFNNPISIALGKLGPALMYGNAIVWKPAPSATKISRAVLTFGLQAGLPPSLIQIVCGGSESAAGLARHPGVDAVTVTGSLDAGLAMQDLCALRHIPLQAEMGSNNASIVWFKPGHRSLPRIADDIARGAFAFAGQRCTANRRVIVLAPLLKGFVKQLVRATAGLGWGDPREASTVVGPVIHPASALRIAAVIDRARTDGLAVFQPHLAAGEPGPQGECYVAPTIVVAPDPDHEIVQEETFGPVLVVQPVVKKTFDEAVALCNGIRQGLAAALWGGASAQRQQFLREARAGVLKLDQPTAGVDHTLPFGGWKASAIGPPEHGPFDREFYTRAQAIYR